MLPAIAAASILAFFPTHHFVQIGSGNDFDDFNVGCCTGGPYKSYVDTTSVRHLRSMDFGDITTVDEYTFYDKPVLIFSDGYIWYKAPKMRGTVRQLAFSCAHKTRLVRWPGPPLLFYIFDRRGKTVKKSIVRDNHDTRYTDANGNAANEWPVPDDLTAVWQQACSNSPRQRS